MGQKSSKEHLSSPTPHTITTITKATGCSSYPDGKAHCLTKYLLLSLKIEKSSWCLTWSFTHTYQHWWCGNVLCMIPKEKGDHQYHPAATLKPSAMTHLQSILMNKCLQCYGGNQPLPKFLYKTHSMRWNPCLTLLNCITTWDYVVQGPRKKTYNSYLIKGI